jgi:hypothetical protein
MNTRNDGEAKSVGSAIRQMQLHTCEIEIDEQPCSRETYFQSVYTTLKSVGQRLGTCCQTVRRMEEQFAIPDR